MWLVSLWSDLCSLLMVLANQRENVYRGIEEQSDFQVSGWKRRFSCHFGKQPSVLKTFRIIGEPLLKGDLLARLIYIFGDCRCIISINP